MTDNYDPGGELMRSILREFHATVLPQYDGPFYVTYERGDFTLYPFRRGHHYVYRVLPLFLRPDCSSPEWVFEVMGR
jgi:hypothetical protein